MFIFMVTIVDFLQGNIKLFFVFYLLSIVILEIKLIASNLYKKPIDTDVTPPSFSVVIPVFGEPLNKFRYCIESVINAAPKAQMVVVENGSVSQYESIAHEFGAEYINIETASKREAIAQGVLKVDTDVVVLLDSDTIVTRDAIDKLLRAFADPMVGGAVPRQSIYWDSNNLVHRLCDWYEDIRFGNTTPGLSYFGQVPCLIGRLYAVRRSIIAKHLNEFTNQNVLGIHMETGDDRVITNYILQDGYKTVYDSSALVWTFAPDTVLKFAKQRLRWSRSSFRETILALPWLWKHPYAFFVMWSDIIMRWLFAAVIVMWILGGHHFLYFSLLQYLVFGLLGFFASGWIKQIPHLRRCPEDFWYVPMFMLWNTFILTPVEWLGNITCLKQGWMTRVTEK